MSKFDSLLDTLHCMYVFVVLFGFLIGIFAWGTVTQFIDYLIGPADDSPKAQRP